MWQPLPACTDSPVCTDSLRVQTPCMYRLSACTDSLHVQTLSVYRLSVCTASQRVQTPSVYSRVRVHRFYASTDSLHVQTHSVYSRVCVYRLPRVYSRNVTHIQCVLCCFCLWPTVEADEAHRLEGHRERERNGGQGSVLTQGERGETGVTAPYLHREREEKHYCLLHRHYLPVLTQGVL